MGINLQARVFNILEPAWATYLKGTYQTPGIGKLAYEDSSGASTVFTKEVGYNTSFEFGFYYNLGNWGLRLSGELIRSQPLVDISGGSSGGTEWMLLDSQLQATVYKLGIEYAFPIDQASKFYIVAALGTASVKLTNNYDVNGSSPYGVADFQEEGSTTLIVGELASGYEYNFGDQTTVILDLGYRVFNVTDLKHDKDVTDFLGGSTSGSAMKNSDGTDREIDLSGFYISLMLRFFIHL